MKIDIKGAIIPDSHQWIYDYFEIPAISALKFNKLLSQAKDQEEIELMINSPGGMVHAGSEMYSIIKSYQGPTKANVLGVAASAASVILCGVDKVEVSPAAQIMIHNAACGPVYGDYNEMDQASNMLKTVNESIAHAYMIKTGMNRTELLALMNKTTWMTAEKAVELGFADKVMFIEGPKLTNSIETDSNGLLPQEVINKVRNEFKHKINNGPSVDQVIEETVNKSIEKLALAKSRLNLAINI